jgi:hypothetical protein
VAVSNNLPEKPGWCCRRELNSRPLPYQGSALPLSYGSIAMPVVRKRFKYLIQCPRRKSRSA